MHLLNNEIDEIKKSGEENFTGEYLDKMEFKRMEMLDKYYEFKNKTKKFKGRV